MRLLLAFVMAAAAALAQLQGLVDIHVHSDPDSAPRSVDALEAARLAKQEGVRALLLKNHYAPTVQLAFTVSRVVDGITLYGGLVLNRSVGGVNPAAVEQAARFKGGFGKVVWMPTFDAENQVRFSKENRPYVSVSRNGTLLPEVREVLKIMVREKMSLATGHSTPAEDLMLIREARQMGITRIVVTHPMKDPVRMSIDEMREAAKLGAYLEFDASGVLPAGGANALTIERYVKAVHAVGAEHCILSSDLGQAANPVHTVGWKKFLSDMAAAGVKPDEIQVMTRRNPARFLGLE